MLIEGSSGSSGGLVGEHQPDEPMRDGGRWAGRPLAVMSEMKVSQEDVAARGCAWRGVSAGTTSRFRPNRALSRGAKTNGLRRARWLSPPPLSQHCANARNELCAKKALERATVRALESSATAEVHGGVDYTSNKTGLSRKLHAISASRASCSPPTRASSRASSPRRRIIL
jgi:hypothetical protein